MLSISGLTLGYEETPILQVDQLQLGKGESALITGKSGSGKTTLLYAIAGLIPVMSGEVVVAGTNVSALTDAARDRFRGQHIGIIFQTLHLVQSLTVLQNLALAAYVAGLKMDEAHAVDVLAALGMEGKKDALPERLSQGQAQRVAIARAMFNKPQLILADEPTSSLDDESADAVIGMIQQAAALTGATLVISTHDARVKAHFSNVISLGEAQ